MDFTDEWLGLHTNDEYFNTKQAFSSPLSSPLSPLPSPLPPLTSPLSPLPFPLCYISSHCPSIKSRIKKGAVVVSHHSMFLADGDTSFVRNSAQKDGGGKLTIFAVTSGFNFPLCGSFLIVFFTTLAFSSLFPFFFLFDMFFFFLDQFLRSNFL